MTPARRIHLLEWELEEEVRYDRRSRLQQAINALREEEDADRTLTAPEGVTTMAELVEGVGRCTFEGVDGIRCVLNAEHVGACCFGGGEWVGL